MIRRAINTWAVEARLRPNDGLTLLGLGWFGWPQSAQAHLLGCTTALFPTRREARAAARHLRERAKRSTFECPVEARAVRVTVTIEQRQL